MKRFLLTVVIAAVVSGAYLASKVTAETRTWTSGKYTVDAEFVALDDGKVKLKKANGDVIEVALKMLSGDDRLWVSKQVRAARAAAKSSTGSSGAGASTLCQPPNGLVGAGHPMTASRPRRAC